jgi:2,3-bisphosphoglycerate-dependent phosphoglycerate mutase
LNISGGVKLELLVIRHGQSEADLLGVHEGRADFPLTELGEQQARRMAEFVTAHCPPDILLSSPLKRALKTALILQEAVDCKLVESPDLMEFNNGVLAGMSRAEALIKYPLPPGGRPVHVPIQGGESELEFRCRAEKVLSEIIAEFGKFGRVAVVSHGGLISHFINAFLRQPVSSGVVFATGDTGIHLLELKNDLRIVRFLNKQEHLR